MRKVTPSGCVRCDSRALRLVLVPPAVLPAVPGAVAGVLPLGGGARGRLPRLQCVGVRAAACSVRCARTLTRARAVMGKAEGRGENWHGHVTALTARRCAATARGAPSHARRRTQVAPEYRRQGLAQKLMGILEEITIKRRAPAACLRWCPQALRRLLCPVCCGLTQRMPLPLPPPTQARRLLRGPVCAQVERGGHRHVREGASTPLAVWRLAAASRAYFARSLATRCTGRS